MECGYIQASYAESFITFYCVYTAKIIRAYFLHGSYKAGISPTSEVVQRNLVRDIYKAFRHIETLFVQGRNLVPSMSAISCRGLFTFRQPLASMLCTRFLPWTNKVSTC